MMPIMTKAFMTKMDRRAMIAASGAALLVPRALFAQPRGDAFSWEMVIGRAQRLTRAPFAVTPFFPGADKIGYDAFNQARFRDERTIWNDLGGDTGIRLFPLSSTVQQPVEIALVDRGRATPLRYDPDMFDAPPGNAVRNLGPDAGFSGFRIMNEARDGDWLSFLGATYFRAPAEKQFGLSARAVAINTSIAGKEEFPRFTHFWLERTGRSNVTVYALMDSASLTGAFRFANELTPQGVRQDVDAVLFARKAISELGLMPMTSMFWYDQADRAKRTDWRPEIHDSDMLSIASVDGTAHCRPLVNPSAPASTSLRSAIPRASACSSATAISTIIRMMASSTNGGLPCGRPAASRWAPGRSGSTPSRPTANIPTMSPLIGPPPHPPAQGAGSRRATGSTGRRRGRPPRPASP